MGFSSGGQETLSLYFTKYFLRLNFQAVDCFVVLDCHQLVLDGLINVFKLFHNLRSAVD